MQARQQWFRVFLGGIAVLFVVVVCAQGDQATHRQPDQSRQRQVWAGDAMAASRETVPVPEVSVDEDRQLFGGKRDIRLARSSAVVGLKMNASPFEVGKDAFFYPCIPGADARHDLASLLFREHVGHCGRSGLEGDSYVFGDSGDDWDRHRVSDLLV